MRPYCGPTVAQKANEYCEKCGTLGPRDVAFVKADIERPSHWPCVECSEDHLHVYCERCGVSECMKLAPQRQKVSAA